MCEEVKRLKRAHNYDFSSLLIDLEKDSKEEQNNKNL